MAETKSNQMMELNKQPNVLEFAVLNESENTKIEALPQETNRPILTPKNGQPRLSQRTYLRLICALVSQNKCHLKTVKISIPRHSATPKATAYQKEICGSVYWNSPIESIRICALILMALQIKIFCTKFK